MTATSAPKPVWNAATLIDRLRQHYIRPGETMAGGVFLSEVGLNGVAQQRRCDALYVGFTSTSGRQLVGHEVKASRADWLHELDQPHKADRWADQCHAWYVVAPDTIMVPPEELPEGWGLMTPAPRGNRMLIVRRAVSKGPDHSPSWLVMRSVLANWDTNRANLIRQGINAAEAKMQVAADKRAQEARDSGWTPDMTRVRAIIDRVKANLRTQGQFAQPTEDEIVQVLTDLVATRDVANHLQRITRDKLWDLQRAIAAIDPKTVAMFETMLGEKP